ncbi:hypothetical protein DFS34DRAFT_381295 [Phlyctochytrium arcticum]|nr:hypothetical protein DFS34DRAFT_381295 [Phlyctochytrium arcticum]
MTTGSLALPDQRQQPPPVGTRVCVAGDFGTVRYFGPVPKPSPEITSESQTDTSKWWYGIEWDDPTRGKHAGEHKGISYFTTHNGAPSGSFVRAATVTAKDSFPRSFLAALLEKYAPQHVIEDSVIQLQPNEAGVLSSDKKIAVETVGWAKVARKIGKLDELREVGLAGQRVGYAIDAETAQTLTMTCPAIEDLDLSRNLFDSWDQVADICRQLPHLESLRLAYNRIKPVPQPPMMLQGAFQQLKALTLMGTLMPWSEVQTIEPYLPALETLHFHQNQFSSFLDPSYPQSHGPDGEPYRVSGFANLTLLNLDDNAISDWNVVRAVVKLPKLQTLMLANNQISNVAPPDPTEFQHLTTLNISGNRLATWSAIHVFNTFPALTELRVRRNPVLEEFSTRPSDILAFLLARVSRLTSVNGSAITPKERRDGELFYLTKCAEELRSLLSPAQLQTLQLEQEQTNGPLHMTLPVAFEAKHPRYRDLCVQYGPPSMHSSAATATSTLLKDRLVSVQFLYHPPTHSSPITAQLEPVTKKIPATMMLRVLRVLAARSLRIPPKFHASLTLTHQPVQSSDESMSTAAAQGQGSANLAAGWLAREGMDEGNNLASTVEGVPMDDWIRDVDFYGVEDGDTILVSSFT